MSTLWSVIVNRMDGLSTVWKEWRAKIVTTTPGPNDPNPIVIPMLVNSTGKLDPTVIPPLTPSDFNSVRVTLDFGRQGPLFYENDEATATVIGQAWVTATSNLLCQPAMVATTDHDPDDVWAEEITAYTTNIVPGVGFDVVATCPNGTWGQYFIDVVGA